MNTLIKKVPIPMAGLMLALAVSGNLVLSYGQGYRNAFGILSAALLLLLVLKLAVEPKAIQEGFENPVVASVTPTLSMGIMLLSTYLKPFLPEAAFGAWVFGLLVHVVLILFFTKKYIFSFNIKKVFPSYFVVYVGIAVASVTAPAFGLAVWGQGIFWYGLISYILLLPIVLYRVIKVKEIPEPALPTLTIFAAPASLLVVGYLNSFQQKNAALVSFLVILSFVSLAAVLFNMPRLLRLKFNPSYSAFTFPIVISGVAMKGVNSFLINTNQGIEAMQYLVKFMEGISVLVVLYVLARYIVFLFPQESAAANDKSGAAAVKK